MDKHCININHPKVKELAEGLKVSLRVAAAKIAIWQENNNYDMFPTLEQIKDSVKTTLPKQFEIVDEPYVEQLPVSRSQQQVVETLDSMNKNFIKQPETQADQDRQYVEVATNLVVTSKTASTLGKKFKGEKNEERLAFGNLIGDAYEDILNQRLEGVSKVLNTFKLEDYVFQQLENSVSRLLYDIYKHQDLINKRDNTDKVPVIRTQQILVDKEAKIGGAADIIVLYSDNTAEVLDIKTISTFINEEGKVQQDKIYMDNFKREKYKLQINAYARILKKIGVKQVTRKRIVPVAVSKKEEGGYIVTTTGISGTVVSNLIVDKESTGIEKLDRFNKARLEVVNRLENDLKLLNRKKKQGEKVDKDIEIVLGKIARINQSLEEVYLNMSFDKLLNSVYELRKEVYEELDKTMEEMDMRKVTNLVDELKTLLDLQDVIFEVNKFTDNYDEEDLEKVLKKQREVFYEFKNIYAELESVQRIILIEWLGMEQMVGFNKRTKTVNNMKNMKSDGFLMSYLGNLSDQSNPILQKILRKITDLDAAKTAEWNNYVKELRKYTALPGIDKIIDRKAKRLVHKYDMSFTKEIREDSYSVKSILKYFNLPENYDYPQMEKEYKEILDSIYRDSEGKFPHETLKKLYESKLKTFERNNRLYDKEGKLNEDTVKSLYRRRALEIKDTKLTEEYKNLSPELKEALDWFISKNESFRDMVDIADDYELSNSFIPITRKDIVDRWRDNESMYEFFKSQFNYVTDNLTRLASDVEYGAKKISIPYLNTSENRNEVGDDMSFDLFESFLKFSDFAFHYKHFNNLEPYFNSLKGMLVDKAIVNNEKVIEGDAFMKQYNDTTSYYIYRERFKSDSKLEKWGKESFLSSVLGKPVSVTKIINEVSAYESARTLGFNWMSSSASHVAGRTSVFIEAKKGNLFTVSQHNTAVKDMVTNRQNYLSFCGFFNVYPEAETARLGLEPGETHWLTSNNPDRIKAYVGSRNSLLFKSWQWGEEDVTNVVTVSMGQNYGIDENGRVRHMRFLPEGSKSLYESFKYEDGVITFFDQKGKPLENSEQIYSDFRKAVRAGIRNTVGTANEQDMARYKMYLAGRLFMKYTTWLPGVLLERIRNTRVNEYAQVMEMGRYKAIFSDLDNMKGKALLAATGFRIMEVVSNLLFLGGIVGQNFSKLDRTKVSLEFERWKAKMREENPYELEKLEEMTTDPEKQLDLYISARQGQLKAAVLELRILLGLVLAVAMLSRVDMDGDDEPDVEQSIALRRLIRLTDKVRTEIGFVFSLKDWENTISRPLPLISILTDLRKALFNFGDESLDAIRGENYKYDNTGWLAFTKKFFPGWKLVDPLFDELEKKIQE